MDNRTSTTVTTLASDAFQGGGDRRLKLDLRGQVVTVTVDDKALFQAPLAPGVAAGQVTLGLTNESEDVAGKVRFSELRILSL